MPSRTEDINKVFKSEIRFRFVGGNTMVLRGIPCVLMRGGTSKGVLFKREDLPPEGPQRDKVIVKIFGSGDPSQIDGLGGSRTHTSKTMIVWKSDRSENDIEYTFGQVGVEKPLVDWTGNCGNLTSAVAPFAIDEKILEAKEPYTSVRMYNTNTEKRIDAKVPVKGSSTEYEGEYRIDGVPNPGSRIDVRWWDPGGALSGKLLPTGNPVDRIDTGLEVVEGSIVDAANPAVFVRAEDIGLTGRELPEEISEASFLKLERIRSKAAELMGLVKEAKNATEKSVHFPYIAMVGERQNYKTGEGQTLKKDQYSILARLFSMQKMHHTYPVTGAICTGAAAKIPESIVNRLFEGKGNNVVIGHPRGLIEVVVEAAPAGENIEINSVTIGRTARRLMAGKAFYIP